MIDAVRPTYAAPLQAVHHLQVSPSQAPQENGSPAASAFTFVATVAVDPEEPNLRGHFPGFPIYPGVFIVETLCQAMAAALHQGGPRPRLREVKSLRLTAPLEGGDELTMTATVTPRDEGWRVQATGTRRDGQSAATVTAVFDRAEAA